MTDTSCDPIASDPGRTFTRPLPCTERFSSTFSRSPNGRRHEPVSSHLRNALETFMASRSPDHAVQTARQYLFYADPQAASPPGVSRQRGGSRRISRGFPVRGVGRKTDV
jgi:hypothetical protein